MKDIDAVSRYIDSLIVKYFVAAFIMRGNDVLQRPFAYDFDVFLNCLNPLHVKNADHLPKYTTVPTPLVFYYTVVRFFIIFFYL